MSRASAIEDWLRNVVLASPPGRCRTRRCPSPPIAERPAKRRRPLQSLNANAMPPRTFSSSPAKNLADVDETPRQVRYALRSAPGGATETRPPPSFSLERFNPPNTQALYASTQQPPSPTRTSSSASTGRSSNKRSMSPVKGLADLMYSNAFNYKSMYDAEDDELGGDIDELCARLREMQQCDGVVPQSARVHVQALPRRLRDEFYERNYDKAQPDNRSRDRVMQEFLDINEIMQTSNRYGGLAYSEAAWNDAVHSKVLQVALRGLDGIEWQNITQASISPRDLIPLHHLHILGSKLEGKMVDYALSISPSQTLTDRITSLLQLEAASKPELPALHQSINHTTYAPLRLSPISVSIETKTPDGNQSEAKGQLAVWSAAHLSRLDRLRRAVQVSRSPSEDEEQEGSSASATVLAAPLPAVPPLPTLPLILAAGASWHLYFIKMDDSGKVTMFDYRPLGDTASLLGIYKLLCGIRALADWTSSSLRQWYDELAVAGGL